MHFPSLSTFLSRLALAFCFLGFGIWEILAPGIWTTYLPAALSNFYPIILIEIHGVALTVCALGVLWGRFPKFFTGLSFLIMFDICAEIWLQEGFTDVLIRDVAILLFIAAMFAHSFHRAGTSS